MSLLRFPMLQSMFLKTGALMAVFLLAGCATGYGGGYPGGSYPGSQSGGYGTQRLVGTVQDVDPYNGRLLIGDDRYGGSRPLEVRFDRNVLVVYRGQQVAVDGLERGDRVSMEVESSGGRYWARRIEVVQNVREGYGGDPYGGGYYGGGSLDGAVDYIDAQRRMIVLTRGGYSGSRETVYYDGNTTVEYGGRLYRPEQLERGDVISIQGRRLDNGWLAERIRVEVDVRSR